ncbi:MAG: L-2-hydroxyglutarate oxidase [Candidatus Omnitrophota bacterium]|jgi:L-2-hydroxyglutarate oxidase LhgO
MEKYDFLVIGGGIVGLTVALEIAHRRMGSVAVLEKEMMLGMHSSGRNSGVIHTGIYYAPGSLKAHLCVSGAKRLWDYAEEKKLPHRRIGKTIVTTREEQLPILDDLQHHAKANGVRVEMVDEKKLSAIEPHARTFRKALYSPDTAVIDPKTVLEALAKDIAAFGGHIFYDARVLRIDAARRSIITNRDTFQYGHLVNAAGLEADCLAHQLGVGLQYRILPFKGAYKKISPESPAQFHGLVYPTPDPQLPFLGVHITKNVYGEVFLGPTAMPALGRENYTGFKKIDFLRLPANFWYLGYMFVTNRNGFFNLVRSEIAKYSARGFFEEVKKLSPVIRAKDIIACDKVGIRAQPFDCSTKQLVMDFLVEKGPASTHILNAVSPAFTSSFALAENIADGIEKNRFDGLGGVSTPK